MDGWNLCLVCAAFIQVSVSNLEPDQLSHLVFPPASLKTPVARLTVLVL